MMVNLILVITARILFFLISPISFIYVLFIQKKFTINKLYGYWRSEAINLDRYGNYSYRTILNAFLKTKNGYEFGNFNETISSALGKNERDNTLSKKGKLLVKILDFLDENHCEKSIKEF